jgi:hypothetical protein
MINVTEKIVNILTNDSQLNNIVPAKNIFVGPTDIVEEKQNGLFLPQINIHLISEISRTVPSNTRDVIYQIDIWTRNNQLELDTIYERVLDLLNYLNTDYNTSHIFWQRLSSSDDLYESDRRIWHRAVRFTVWAQ